MKTRCTESPPLILGRVRSGNDRREVSARRPDVGPSRLRPAAARPGMLCPTAKTRGHLLARPHHGPVTPAKLVGVLVPAAYSKSGRSSTPGASSTYPLLVFLFSGPKEASWTLLLAHGAGAGMDTPWMERVA